jgi:hypothetical protein
MQPLRCPAQRSPPAPVAASPRSCRQGSSVAAPLSLPACTQPQCRRAAAVRGTGAAVRGRGRATPGPRRARPGRSTATAGQPRCGDGVASAILSLAGAAPLSRDKRVHHGRGPLRRMGIRECCGQHSGQLGNSVAMDRLRALPVVFRPDRRVRGLAGARPSAAAAPSPGLSSKLMLTVLMELELHAR